MRGALVRSLAVLGVGLAVLAGILFYASTVDGRPPLVERIALSQHQSGDDRVALTTTTIEVDFSEPVRTESAEAAFRIEPAVDGTFSWRGATMTFTPAERLPIDTAFTAWVEAVVDDVAGNRMPEPSERFAFQTTGRPVVTATDPADGTDEVALDAAIVITFSTLMDTASVEDALRIRPSIALEPSWSAEVLTLTPTRQLAEGTRYTVSIETDALDSAGIALAATFRFAFETTRSPLAPAVLVPADDTGGIAVTTPVAIVLDRAIDPDSVDAELLRIEPEVAGSLEAVAAPGAAGMRDGAVTMLRFTPSAPLAANTTYRVSLDPGLRGAGGEELAEPVQWTFTTGTPLASLSNQIVFLSDRSGIANLWAMNPDGSVQRQLSAELSPVIAYALAPDGRTFVVGDGAVLVRQEAGGGGRTVLTPADTLEFDPAWAPDGSRLVFGRADRETGEGLGLWSRAEDGGDATRLELPEELAPEPGPSAAPDGGPEPGTLLRAPVFAPDGQALAFVDLAGRVGVLELPAQRLSTAAWAAAGAPVWLLDSTAVLVAGHDGPTIDPPQAGQPFAAFDPAETVTDVARMALRVAQLDRGARTVRQLELPPGAIRPAIGRDGLLFVASRAGDRFGAGTLRLAADPRDPADHRRLLDDDGAIVVSATFGVEAGTIVAARLNDGIWLVDTDTGEGAQLAADGWLPRRQP